MIRQAECCCGDAFVRVKGEPALYGLCHCDNCKQRTGSAFGMNAYFKEEQILEKSGDMGIYVIRDEQQRFFCKRCGTTLFWTSSWRPGSLAIAAGCFVDNPLAAPALTVSNEAKCDWLSLPADWATSVSD
ncbi:MAG: GFA family protein [Pseudomonadota bacterium]